MATKYHIISWDQLHQDARTLCAQLAGQGPDDGAWRGIVAITRGGLVPAAILASEMNCRMIESVAVATYQSESRGEPMVLKAPAAAGDGAGFLVVDDLADTGTTLRLVRGLLPRAHFVCLYAKPAGRDYVDRYVADFPQDTWIVFPWDQKNRGPDTAPASAAAT